jgi:GTPase Era involved in 16S rRNA processing
MHRFRVAIVGRPNVGKSTLFNRLCGTRKAIVGDEPGITRDRIYGTANWRGITFELLDTGGMIPNVRDVIPAKILDQVHSAIRESDLLLFVVDGRAGVTAPDEQLLPILRRLRQHSCWKELETQHLYPSPSVVILSRQEADQNRLLYLDMIEDAWILRGVEGVFPVSPENFTAPSAGTSGQKNPTQ